MNNYQRISCEDHSIYELVIMRNQSMKVSINSEVIRIKPIDIITENGVEFLVFIDEKNQRQQLCADQITIQK